MKRLTGVILILILAILSLKAQKLSVSTCARVDSVMGKVPSDYTYDVDKLSRYVTRNFKTEETKLMAIYCWIVKNIAYDQSMLNNPRSTDESTWTGVPSQTLKNRKGVCFDFALLFEDLARKSGCKAFFVDGYVKQSGIVMSVSHRWCVAKVGDEWYGYDPTWDATGVNAGKKNCGDFEYCKLSGADMIKKHMPYDPIWQLMESPVSYDAFDGKLRSKVQSRRIDYKKHIAGYDGLTEYSRLKGIASRISSNGTPNSLVNEYLSLQTDNIEIIEINNQIARYNESAQIYNVAIHQMKEYMDYYSTVSKREHTTNMVNELRGRQKEFVGNFRQSYSILNDIDESIKGYKSTHGVPLDSQVKTLKKSIQEVDAYLRKHNKILDKKMI